MPKKLYILTAIIFILSVFGGCTKEASTGTQEEIPPWVGQFVMTNTDTEEFKILTIDTATEEEVVYNFKSARGTDSFTGVLKTKSKKYAVCNAGERCLKFDLKSSSTYVAVDDIWTSEEERNENWTGKYIRLEEGQVIENFGDSSWNGRYTCADNGYKVEVCAIKEGIVLLTYKDPETEEELNFKCSVSPDSKRTAVFSDEERTIEIQLMRSNKSVVITETLASEEVSLLSGRYAI